MKNERGYIVLISLLVILAVMITFGTLVIFLSIDEALSSVAEEDISRAYGAAGACIEEAILRIKRDPNYAGTGGAGIDVRGITCAANVQRAGNTYTIRAEASTARALRRITVEAVRTGGSVTLSNWSETY